MRIAVTGATGNLGGLIIDYLIARDVAPGDITAIVRDEAKAADLMGKGVQLGVADYEDEAALTTALAGVERLVLVSSSEIGKRAAHHANVINAAKAAGVKYIVYTSLLKADTSNLGLAPEHVVSEQLLKDSGIDHTVLRNGWYWENYAAAIESGKAAGKFFGAAGSAQVSGAARRDYAQAAAVVATSDGHIGKVYELAGAPALSYQEIANEVGKVIGSDVEYVNQSVEEYQATLEGFGMLPESAAIFAGMDPIIEQGDLYSDSTDLQDLIGRPSTSPAEAFTS